MLRWKSEWRRCNCTTCRGSRCSFSRKPLTCCASADRPSCTPMFSHSTFVKTTSPLYLRYVPYTNLQFGFCSFQIAASAVWNSLSSTTHLFQILNSFRKHLKPICSSLLLIVPSPIPLIHCVEWLWQLNFVTYLLTYLRAFSALTLLVGGRKGIWPVRNWVVQCWHGCVSESRCTFAYSPADATVTHYLLLQ